MLRAVILGVFAIVQCLPQYNELLRLDGSRKIIRSKEFSMPVNLPSKTHKPSTPISHPIGKLNGKSGFLSSLRVIQRMSDTGHFNVCGPPGADISCSWQPKVLSAKSPAEVTVDLVAPISLETGIAHFEVSVQGAPIYNMKQAFTCEQLKQYVPNLTCPIKKGRKYSASFRVNDIGSIPANNYTVVISVTEGGKKLFACFNATIEKK